MLTNYMVVFSVAFYQLIALAAARSTPSLLPRDTYNHGNISVEVLASDKGFYSKLKVRDSLSTTLNGKPIPTSDQSTVCTIHLTSRGVTPCDSPDWHYLLTETGHDDDAGSGSIRIYHHVNYQSSPAFVDAGNGFLTKDPNAATSSLRYYRQTYNVLVFLGGKAASKEYSVCEQPTEPSSSKETYSFIQGPAPSVPQKCWILNVDGNAHYDDGT